MFVASRICAAGSHGGAEVSGILDGLGRMLALGLGTFGAMAGLFVCAARMLDKPSEAQGTAAIVAFTALLGVTAGLPLAARDQATQGWLRHADEVCPAGPVDSGAVSVASIRQQRAEDEPFGVVTLTTARHELRATLVGDGTPHPQYLWSVRRVGEGEAWAFDAGALHPLLRHMWDDQHPVTLLSIDDDVAWVLTSMTAVRLSLRDRVATPVDLFEGAFGSRYGALLPEHVVALDGGRVAFMADAGPMVLGRDRLEPFADRVPVELRLDFEDDVRRGPEFACFLAETRNAPQPPTQAYVIPRREGATLGFAGLRVAFGSTGLAIAGASLALLLAIAIRAGMRMRGGAVDQVVLDRIHEERVALALGAFALLVVTVLALTQA